MTRAVISASIAFLLLAPSFVAAHQAPEVSTAACVRYLGNEGVLIERGGVKIIFDAFYTESYGEYALVPDAISNALLKGAPPYDDIDAVFVSHAHGDHFTPAPTLAFLEAHPAIAFFASKQTVDALIAAGASPAVQKRLTAFDINPGDAPVKAEFDGVEIDVVAIPHAAGIQNLAFRVTLNSDTTVLHLGDAEPDDSAFAPHQAHWDAKRLDIAFPPYWFMDGGEGAAILDERLKASYNIGVHAPAAAAGKGDELRAQAGGDLFTDPGETRIIGSAAGDFCQ